MLGIPGHYNLLLNISQRKDAAVLNREQRCFEKEKLSDTIYVFLLWKWRIYSSS